MSVAEFVWRVLDEHELSIPLHKIIEYHKSRQSYYRKSLGDRASICNVAPSSSKSKLEVLRKARARNHASRPFISYLQHN
jgi:hypothetical protein